MGGWVGLGWYHKINAFFRFYRKISALVSGWEGEKILEIFTIYFVHTTKSNEFCWDFYRKSNAFYNFFCKVPISIFYRKI